MTIKGYVLDALQKFWNKLKTTYVTDCDTDDDNLALAASQGKALQDQITPMTQKTTKVSQVNETDSLTMSPMPTGSYFELTDTHAWTKHGNYFVGGLSRSGDAYFRSVTAKRDVMFVASGTHGSCGLYDLTNPSWILESKLGGTEVYIPHTLITKGYYGGSDRPVVSSEMASSGNHTVSVLAGMTNSLVVQSLWGTTTFSNRSISVPAGSDRRLKTNIKPAEKSGLDLINALDIVQFDWKDGSGHWDFGIIAQDAGKLDENISAGEETEDSYLTLNLMYLTDILLKAVQELSFEVEKLKAEVEVLKN